MPTASTEPVSATYFIASEKITDATTCQTNSTVAGCSISAILVPVPKPKLATTCPNEHVYMTVASPKLNPIEVDSKSVAGTVRKATSGKVQLCSGNTLIGDPAEVNADGGFKVTLPKVTAGQPITAQFTNAANVSGPTSTPDLIVGSCLADQSTSLPKPILTRPTDSTGGTYKGTLPGVTSGMVRICVDGLPSGDPLKVEAPTDGSSKDGVFSVGSIDVQPGQVIQAQALNSATPAVFGPVSDQLAIGQCSAIGTGDVSAMPTVKRVEFDGLTVSGNVPKMKAGTVRICVADAQVATAPIDENGNFTATLPTPVKVGQSVVAQTITSSSDTFPVKYGLVSEKAKLGYAYPGFSANFVGGIEESGFSSQGLNTSGFLNIFVQSAYFGKDLHSAAVWGRVQ